MKTRALWMTLLLGGSLLGCATSRHAGPHPMVGTWTYELHGPDGVGTGIVTISETEAGLAAVAEVDPSGELIPLENVRFVDHVLYFEFDTDEGRWTATLPVQDDQYEGTIATTDGQISGVVLKGHRQRP